jgi:hypothetical protein
LDSQTALGNIALGPHPPLLFPLGKRTDWQERLRGTLYPHGKLDTLMTYQLIDPLLGLS